MAIITAQAKFYNAFKCRVVDKNITANLSASFTMAHPDPTDPSGSSPGALPVTVLRSDNNALRVNAGLSMTGSYAIKGGLIKGNQSMTVTSRLRLQFSTFVEIDWYKLEIPEGKNVTIQMEEGFVIEDRNKFPFALGSPLAFNGNLLSFRTPKRGFVTPINSAFTLPNVAYIRNRFNQAALTSAFSPTLVAQLNRFGVIDLQSAFQQTTIAGFRKFYASQMQAEFGGFFTAGGVARIATGLRIKQLELNASSEFTMPDISDTRVRLGNINMSSSFALDAAPVKEAIFNLTLVDNVGMSIDAVKTVSSSGNIDVVSNINSQINLIAAGSSMLLSNSNQTSIVNRRVNPNTAMTSTFTLVQSFDTILEWDTSKYFQVYNFPTATAPAPRVAAFYLNNRTGPVTVIWGDGTSNILASGDDSYIQHEYAVDGIYEIRIRGRFAIFGPNDAQATATGDSPVLLGQRLRRWNANSQLTKVKGWGEHGLTSLRLTFSHCRNLNIIPNETIPDSAITDMRSTFEFTSSAPNVGFNQPLSNLDTSLVTTMRSMFANADAFNQPIGNWNTSSVTDMDAMFSNARFFDQDISSWCVQNIPVKPTDFDLNGTSSWTTAEKPNWGAPC